ncbi:MAG: late competence development ComFB family protein [Ruminiclostridium sp.]|nr:late competence development ComFB family protein [Ruminiclostridium sp.]
MLINMMEHYVDERLAELLVGNNCCKCEVCIEDMKAYALNRLPSRYVSTVNGEVFTRITQELESQPTVDLDVAVLQAIAFISTHPRHKK